MKYTTNEFLAGCIQTPEATLALDQLFFVMFPFLADDPLVYVIYTKRHAMPTCYFLLADTKWPKAIKSCEE